MSSSFTKPTLCVCVCVCCCVSPLTYKLAAYLGDVSASLETGHGASLPCFDVIFGPCAEAQLTQPLRSETDKRKHGASFSRDDISVCESPSKTSLSQINFFFGICPSTFLIGPTWTDFVLHLWFQPQLRTTQNTDNKQHLGSCLCGLLRCGWNVCFQPWRMSRLLFWAMLFGPSWTLILVLSFASFTTVKRCFFVLFSK